MALAFDREKFRQSPTSNDLRDTLPESDHEWSVFALFGILDGNLMYIRWWEIWMRAFRICGCSLNVGSGRADSVLDFLFSRGQRIVRDVQSVLRYFGFDYAV